MTRPDIRTKIFWALLSTISVVVGCGYAALPVATSKTVRPSDIVGAWRYRANPREALGKPEDDGVVTISFDASGSFEQTIVPPGDASPIIQTGKWKLDGSNLQLFGILEWDFEMPSTSPPSGPYWMLGDSVWMVVDSIFHPGQLAIFGGNLYRDDPDAGHELERLPATVPK